jgi:hypothetical protein
MQDVDAKFQINTALEASYCYSSFGGCTYPNRYDDIVGVGLTLARNSQFGRTMNRLLRVSLWSEAKTNQTPCTFFFGK